MVLVIFFTVHWVSNNGIQYSKEGNVYLNIKCTLTLTHPAHTIWSLIAVFTQVH